MKLENKFLFAGILLGIILSMYFVAAAIDAPTGLVFYGNDTANYDADGAVFLNWTAPVSSGEENYNISIALSGETTFNWASNDSATGYTFTNTTDGNYSFIVQAWNTTSIENSTANFWMVVDTTVPALVYSTVGTPSNGTALNRNWVFVNVTSVDSYNHSVTYELWNTSLVNRTTYTTNITSINWTGLLKDVAYYYNVTANDSATNSNSTITRTIYLDNTSPSVNIECSPSSVNRGATFPCTCSGSDNLGGVSSTTGSSDAPEETSSPLTSGTYTYTCTVLDNAGNSAVDTLDYTVRASLGPGSSSSGGSSSATIQKQKTFQWTKITPGTAQVMKDFDSEIGVKQIRIQVRNEVQNVKVTVKKYDQKPAEVSVEKSGKVNQYLQIDTENLNENLEVATARVRVEKSWISDNDFEKEDIALYKLDESLEKWNELVTDYADEDNDYYYYDVSLDSFSYFSISAKSFVKGEESSETEGQESADGGEPTGMNYTWLWIALGVIAVGAVAWFIIFKKKKK